jgi:hypothetical protein
MNMTYGVSDFLFLALFLLMPGVTEVCRQGLNYELKGEALTR